MEFTRERGNSKRDWKASWANEQQTWWQLCFFMNTWSFLFFPSDVQLKAAGKLKLKLVGLHCVNASGLGKITP